jgi:hypothetical protein
VMSTHDDDALDFIGFGPAGGVGMNLDPGFCRLGLRLEARFCLSAAEASAATKEEDFWGFGPAGGVGMNLDPGFCRLGLTLEARFCRSTAEASAATNDEDAFCSPAADDPCLPSVDFSVLTETSQRFCPLGVTLGGGGGGSFMMCNATSSLRARPEMMAQRHSTLRTPRAKRTPAIIPKALPTPSASVARTGSRGGGGVAGGGGGGAGGALGLGGGRSGKGGMLGEGGGVGGAGGVEGGCGGLGWSYGIALHAYSVVEMYAHADKAVPSV